MIFVELLRSPSSRPSSRRFFFFFLPPPGPPRGRGSRRRRISSARRDHRPPRIISNFVAPRAEHPSRGCGYGVITSRATRHDRRKDMNRQVTRRTSQIAAACRPQPRLGQDRSSADAPLERALDMSRIEGRGGWRCPRSRSSRRGFTQEFDVRARVRSPGGAYSTMLSAATPPAGGAQAGRQRARGGRLSRSVGERRKMPAVGVPDLDGEEAQPRLRQGDPVRR